MFDGIAEDRLLAMSAAETRWLDNVKKAFHDSDLAVQDGVPEDGCLEALFKAIDTAKTLRRSLRSEDVAFKENKKRFIEFLGLEIPAARPGGSEFELRDPATGVMKKYHLGEIIYAIRCMTHENENLNAAEPVDYHILLDWSVQDGAFLGSVQDGKFVCNGFALWNRLRQVLSKFITGIEAMGSLARGADRFDVTIVPPLDSIRPLRRRGEQSGSP